MHLYIWWILPDHHLQRSLSPAVHKKPIWPGQPVILDFLISVKLVSSNWFLQCGFNLPFSDNQWEFTYWWTVSFACFSWLSALFLIRGQCFQIETLFPLPETSIDSSLSVEGKSAFLGLGDSVAFRAVYPKNFSSLLQAQLKYHSFHKGYSRHIHPCPAGRITFTWDCIPLGFAYSLTGALIMFCLGSLLFVNTIPWYPASYLSPFCVSCNPQQELKKGGLISSFFGKLTFFL